ncbi:hypothetical protein EJ02DRAFT_452937 [Clathrospora elynae]|uniref:Uncharacterized protein n=1 Tax=Clathrospora elynae TaxID=706981 RepID=A0A6A5T499_9PLEO|nr:hypothetical protein EJ02DRAFT_452937 [Clathrospora elynae]
MDLGTIDTRMCRDMPTAVSYMRRTTHDLDPIEQMAFREQVAFRDLGEGAEGFRKFTKDLDDWNDELIAAF